MARPTDSPLRRSARVQLRISVNISGTHPDGKAFDEDTLIVSVSKYGARLKTQTPLKVGVQLKVQLKDKKSALFRVVWVGKDGTPRAGEVGIEYIEVSDLLGVSFPA